MDRISQNEARDTRTIYICISRPHSTPEFSRCDLSGRLSHAFRTSELRKPSIDRGRKVSFRGWALACGLRDAIFNADVRLKPTLR